MKKILTLSAAVLGLAAFATQGSAQVVSVQFGNNTLGGGTLSAGLVPETIWNEDYSGDPSGGFSGGYVAASTSTLSNLVNSNNVATSISENTVNNGYYAQYHTLAFSNPGDQALFANGYLGGFTAPTTFTLNLTGLSSSSSYELVLYMVGTADVSEELSASLGSTTYYFDTATDSSGTNPTSTYVQATSTSSTSPTAVANYVEFTIPSGGTTATATINPAGGQDFNVAGFQLIPIAATPEPSTYVLLGFGLLSLVIISKRKLKA